jgi:hypothetical protein
LRILATHCGYRILKIVGRKKAQKAQKLGTKMETKNLNLNFLRIFATFCGYLNLEEGLPQEGAEGAKIEDWVETKNLEPIT